MEYLKVYTDFEQALEPYADAEAGRIFRAMLKYAEDGTEPNFRGNERFIWPTAKLNIDRTRAEAERNSRNKTQRPSTTVNDRQRPATTVNDTQRPATTVNDSEPKRKEKEKENNTTPLPPPYEGELRAVAAVWEESIGELPRIVLQEAASWMQAGITSGLICEAIREAARNGAGKWAYVEAILRRCAQERRFTMEDFRKGEKQRGEDHGGEIDWGKFGTNS